MKVSRQEKALIRSALSASKNRKTFGEICDEKRKNESIVYECQNCGKEIVGISQYEQGKGLCSVCIENIN